MAIEAGTRQPGQKIGTIFEVDDSRYSHYSLLIVTKPCKTLNQKTTDYYESFKTPAGHYHM